MREIKFRVWLKGQMVYITPDDDYFIDGDGELVRIEQSENGCNYQGFEGYECNLMQYTGLKDVDGIEIYEGDFVECEIGINNDRYVGICEFNKRTAGFEFGKKRTSSYGRTNMTVGRMKNKRVIGNIYENPELLGDSE